MKLFFDMANKVFVTCEKVKYIKYEENTSTLEIGFKSESMYRYFEVPQEIYNSFLEAPSKIEFFETQIKDQYRFSKYR